jgi:hypothetical protein
MMRTTINLDNDLLASAKKVAAESGRTLTDVFEDALRESLARRREARTRAPIALPTFRGSGTLPGVDLDDSAALLDLMEGR